MKTEIFRSDIFKMVKRGRFEVLRKKSSTMTDIVWVEESKNRLRFEIRPSYDDAPTTSPCQADGQSSCRYNLLNPTEDLTYVCNVFECH